MGTKNLYHHRNRVIETIMKPRKAVYAGSFDPLTKGHTWIIERAIHLFDGLTIAVGVNANKEYFLPAEQRKQNIQSFVDTMDPHHCKLEVKIIRNQYLAQFARSVDASCLIRGLRSQGDFHYEYAMAQVNKNLAPAIETVYMIPPPHLAQISSSMVKSLIGPKGWKDLVRSYVPQSVFKSLQKKTSDL